MIFSLVLISCVLASDFTPKAGFTIQSITSSLDGVRTILFDYANGDLIALARNQAQIIALWEPVPLSNQFQSQVLIDASKANPLLNLTHAVQLRGDFIYASSDTSIYRWPYKTGERKTTVVDVSNSEVVVYNMQAEGRGGAFRGHTTRNFVFGPDGFLYIGISSLENIDIDSYRSRVRRIYFPDDTVPVGGFDFLQMEVWADGLRNPLGLAFDAYNQLWETDTGPDNMQRPDLRAGDMYNDNPCEELNLLNGGGTGKNFYGYPYCATIGNLTEPFGQDKRMFDQLAWNPAHPVYTDAWCQNENNVIRPKACMQAHATPITLSFFKDIHGCGKTNVSFPCSMKGDAFVALRGSWNRDLPSGYSVAHIPFDPNTKMPIQSKLDYIFTQEDYMNRCKNIGTSDVCFRPCGLAFKDGILYVSSDVKKEIVRVFYTAPPGNQSSSSGFKTLKGGCMFALFLMGMIWTLI